MCGIAGFISSPDRMSTEEMLGAVSRMTDSLARRGPDDRGAWIDETCPVALGHRRLSIIDLSPLGHQPMISRNGRFVIVFNGEIYNFLDIRRELDGIVGGFRGGSDTEILLEAMAAWGVDATLRKCVGMFALALWDRRERTLTLARDRLGKKPLYFGWSGGGFLFGSELKALRLFPGFDAPVSRQALQQYLRYSYVPAPLSIFQGVYKLPPASWMTISLDQALKPRSIEEQASSATCYWPLRSVVEGSIADRFSGGEEEAVDELDSLLKTAVGCRMIADVPLGAFLSGGVDSSAVVAIMQSLSSRPARTFSIGYEHDFYNEAVFAKAVADHLGTDHTELYVSARDTLDAIPLMPQVYDEPFADASQVPTFLVSKLAREQVTVALSGDGGDELFGGYNRYVWGPRIWESVRRLPVRLRTGLGRAASVVSPQTVNAAFSAVSRALPGRLRLGEPGEKLHKIASALKADSFDSLYVDLCSQWKEPERLLAGGAAPLPEGGDPCPEGLAPSERMMFRDLVTYLPDDILTKVDRASMAVGLEARAPFLDHRVVEFAWRLPPSVKLRDGQGKWILRQALYRYVPKSLMDRPKTGFGIPIGSWLRTSLRDWAEDLLGENRLSGQGLLDPVPIRAKWSAHLSGEGNHQYELWNILMFQAWLHQAR